MHPATGDPVDEVGARSALERLDDDGVLIRFNDAQLIARCLEPGPRAALAALSATIAAPLLDALVADETPVATLSVGVPISPGRIVGPVLDGESKNRVVNERYRSEDPLLVAPSLAHDLLWNTVGAGQFEEATLHLICALVYLQLVMREPALAHYDTELARRQNSLAISVLNSRAVGESELRVIAPDGSGTIPGGAPAMATPDYWSIPFVGGPPATSPAPPLLSVVLNRAVGGNEPLGVIDQYDNALGEAISSHGLRGALSEYHQLRVALTLGLIDEHDLALHSGTPLKDVGAAFGVSDILELFVSP